MASLKSTLDAAIDAAIAGLTPSVVKPIYSAKDGAAGTATRSASNWLTAAGVDISCSSYYDEWSGLCANCTLLWSTSFAGGAAIVATAHHEVSSNPSDHDNLAVKFVTPGGTVRSAVVQTGGYTRVNDIGLFLLSNGLTGVTAAKVLPANWRVYLPTIGGEITAPAADNVPMICCDKEGKTLLNNLYAVADDTPHSRAVPLAYGEPPTNATRFGMHEDAASGDSSGAMCLGPIGNALVFLGPAHYSNWQCDFISDQLAAVNAAMASLNPAASLSQVDLSSFDVFAPPRRSMSGNMQEMTGALAG